MRSFRTKFGPLMEGNVLARAVTLGIVARGGSLIVGFAASVALARFLGPSGRGLLGLMVSVGLLVFVVTACGVPLAVVYFSSQRGADHGALLGNSVVQAIVLAAVLVPATVFLYQPIADLFAGGHGGQTWILAAALVPVTFLTWTIQGQIQGMLKFGRFTVLLLLQKVSYAIAILIFLGVLGLGVAGGLVALACGSCVMIAGSLKPILERGRPKLNLTLGRRTLHYGVRVQIGSIFQLANGRLDVVILGFFRPLSEVGYYVIAQTIAELVTNVAYAFQSSILPLVSHYAGDARQDALSTDSLRHHSILAGVATLGNVVFGPLVIMFAFGSKFQSAIAPMLILLPGVWFLGMGVVIQGDLAGRGRPGLSSALAGLAAGVTVLLDFALIPPLGMYGGALASVAAYTTFGLASLIALRRVTGIPLRELAIPSRRDLGRYAQLLRRASAALTARVRSA